VQALLLGFVEYSLPYCNNNGQLVIHPTRIFHKEVKLFLWVNILTVIVKKKKIDLPSAI
jgi:hypothetical protein